MIASLRGTLIAVRDQFCTIDVQGVGYAVHVTPSHRQSLTIGQEVTVLTSLIVREDSMTLFGFENTESLELFEAFISVSGVGPRSALAILAELSPAEALTAVVNEDDAVFRKVSGIGPKTAKLIILQLAGKLKAISIDIQPKVSSGTNQITESVVQALLGLGWNEKTARSAVESVHVDSSDETTSSLLKKVLASLSKGVRS